MGRETKIEWADHTFNPWIGCEKVSPGCANCYAEVSPPARLSKAMSLPLWGKDSVRQVQSDKYWEQPLKWDRVAKREGVRRRVFCASLADVFEDRPELDVHLARLLGLIHRTQHLDWLLLTKRPELFVRRILSAMNAGYACADPDIRGGGELAERWHCYQDAPSNVWMGASVEDQKRADERIPHLLRIPAAVRFLSVEPLLESIEIGWAMPCEVNARPPSSLADCHKRGIDWVIVGGESGSHARPCHVDWIRGMVRQCSAFDVPVFVKQLGANYVDPVNGVGGTNARPPAEYGNLVRRLIDPKGGDIDEFPEDLRVREIPTTRGC